MEHFFIGIAGGSGCGKSTLAYRFKNLYPNLVEVVHFDDYQKEKEDVPFFENMKNWDHPDAIDFDKLYHDLLQLKDNQEVEIMTKSRIVNPSYEENGRIKHIIFPKKIIIVEGYMAFYDKRIKDLFDFTVFLDLPISESMMRRDKNIGHDETEYNNKILIPMHAKYVEPTKKDADLVIDVMEKNKDEVYDVFYGKLSELEIL